MQHSISATFTTIIHKKINLEIPGSTQLHYMQLALHVGQAMNFWLMPCTQTDEFKCDRSFILANEKWLGKGRIYTLSNYE